MFTIQGQVKDLTGETNDDSWSNLLKVAFEALLEVSKDQNLLRSLPGLIRTNLGTQNSNQKLSQDSSVSAGGGFEAENPNSAKVLNLEDSSAVHRREDVEYFDEERLI